MAIFIRAFHEADKEAAILEASRSIRGRENGTNIFFADPDDFSLIPNSPFAYWVSKEVLGLFSGRVPSASDNRVSLYGLISSDNFRFLRLNWEIDSALGSWIPMSKGGTYSKYYGDIYLSVNTNENFAEIVALANAKYPYLKGKARQMIHADIGSYFQPGVTWTKATTAPLSFRALPRNSVAGNGGSALAALESQQHELLASMAILNSTPFSLLASLSLGLAAEGRKNYEIGIIGRTPCPICDQHATSKLENHSRQSWLLKRKLDTVEETSHAFVLPASLRWKLSDFSPAEIESELAQIQAEVDDLVFELYGFSEADRATVMQPIAENSVSNAEDSADDDEDIGELPTDNQSGLISWAVGVIFGRFDWRQATGERQTPPDPEPFDPLPAKSPGMLPDGAEPFHAHAGVLVDDIGHPHDLSCRVEEALAHVAVTVPDEVRRWLQRDFFAFHLQRYSKSRRKAPIYWPLATASGSYTLWLYYPSLSSQTLYTAVNDFVEPKLKQVGIDGAVLRNMGAARSRDEEKKFEILQAFELELIELRDTLLKIAPGYLPNHNDGVQITAAPLWPLFRHKPWQKVLKDTWSKLEKGDYDWAHLAMNYWPERVSESCKTDKSLAIAHGLEALYVEPEAKPKKAKGRKAKEA